MYLKFEHRVLSGNWFQKDVYINMNIVYAVEIVRTRIIFRRTGFNYYWVPKTDFNLKQLKKFFEVERYK